MAYIIEITEKNYRIVKAEINAIRKQLNKEMDRNKRAILELEKRQKEIGIEFYSYADDMNKIAEFELESEYKFLELIERKCKRCGHLYDKRESKSEELCMACFTSNA